MASIHHSIGSFSGKIGNVVFCSGSKSRRPYIRSVSNKTSEATQEQQATRLRFKLAAALLGPFRTLINDCWKIKQGRKTGYLQAFAELMSWGFEGKYPDISIDISKVQLSAGRLPGPTRYRYIRTGPKLEILWSNSLNLQLPCSLFDEAIVAFYNEELKLAAVYRNVARRADQQVTISIDDSFSGGKLHGWLIFRSEDGKQASTSLYLGDGITQNT